MVEKKGITKQQPALTNIIPDDMTTLAMKKDLAKLRDALKTFNVATGNTLKIEDEGFLQDSIATNYPIDKPPLKINLGNGKQVTLKAEDMGKITETVKAVAAISITKVNSNDFQGYPFAIIKDTMLDQLVSGLSQIPEVFSKASSPQIAQNR